MKVLLTMFLFVITIGLKAQQKNNIDLRIIIASDLDTPKDVSLALNYFDNSNSSINLLKITGKEFVIDSSLGIMDRLQINLTHYL